MIYVSNRTFTERMCSVPEEEKDRDEEERIYQMVRMSDAVNNRQCSSRTERLSYSELRSLGPGGVSSLERLLLEKSHV